MKVSFLFSTAAFLIIATVPLNAQLTRDVSPQISVTGTATVQADADVIRISLGVTTYHDTAQGARDLAANAISKATKAFVDYGLDAHNILADQLRIDPRSTENPYQPTKIFEFRVKSSIMITLSKIEDIEPVIIKALESGVDEVKSVNFEVSNLREYRDQARRSAILAAREKAVDLAEALGATVGRPLFINEAPGNGTSHLGSSWISRGPVFSGAGGLQITSNAIVPQQTGQPDSDDQATVPVGKVVISAEVDVVFELQ